MRRTRRVLLAAGVICCLGSGAAWANEAQDLLQEGRSQHAQGRLTEAAFDYRMALHSDLFAAEPHLDLGAALYQLGRSTEAADELRQCIKAGSRDPLAQMMLALAGSDPAESREAYRLAVQGEPAYGAQGFDPDEVLLKRSLLSKKAPRSPKDSLRWAAVAAGETQPAGGPGAGFVPHYCDEAMAKLRSAELKKLFNADQTDRNPLEGRVAMTGNPLDVMKKVDQADFDHRIRVGEIFAEGCLKTAEDYYDAAMIFQHGNAPDHFLQAHIWAARAAQLGKEEGKWLGAASLDRYLMNTGYKQLFATQAQTETNDPSSCWCLWPVDNSATDRIRQDRNAKTLDQQMAWLKELNKSKSQPCTPKFCTKPAKPLDKDSLPGINL